MPESSFWRIPFSLSFIQVYYLILFLLAEIAIFGVFIINLYLLSKRYFRSLFHANLAGVSAWMVTVFLKSIINDQRPYVIEGAQALIPNPPTSPSFPSGHTATAFAFAISVYFYHRRLGTILLIAATLIGISRIAVLVHSPLDILGGIAVAMILSGFYKMLLSYKHKFKF